MKRLRKNAIRVVKKYDCSSYFGEFLKFQAVKYFFKCHVKTIELDLLILVKILC